MSNQKDSAVFRLLTVWVTENWQVIAASFCRYDQINSSNNNG
jgi:hypothetical protein